MGYDFEKILNKLKKALSEKRMSHTLGVAQTARELAKLYNVEPDKAYLTGLLHDCAKNIENDELYKLCDKYNIELDDIAKKEPKLIHAYVGAYLAREEYEIDDDGVFDAIYYHTTGKENMAPLTKIIFLSDMIEPGRRNLDFLEKAKALAKENLDEALILCLESSASYVMKNGGLLHLDTIRARNFLIGERK